MAEVRSGRQIVEELLRLADPARCFRMMLVVGRQRLAELLEQFFLRLGQKVLLKQRSEEHTSELQSLMRISYAVFGLHKQTDQIVNVIAPLDLYDQQYHTRLDSIHATN